MDIDDLISLKRDLEAKLVDVCPRLLGQFPIADYINRWKSRDDYARYNSIPAEIRTTTEQIRQIGGPELLSIYHKLVLSTLMVDAPTQLATLRLPPTVHNNIENAFRRIAGDFMSNPPAFYRVENDLFLKDIGLCLFKLLPGGMRLFERRSGIPRSILLKKDLSQFLNGTAFFLFKTGGFRPFFEAHTDPRFLEDFNPEGYTRFCTTIAETLVLNPEIKGLFSGSWFYDPALEKISPHLSYLREIPQKNGAKIFYSGPDHGALSNALAKSKTRRRLYEEGKYLPVSYYMVWPRNDLIKWARTDAKTQY